jgi:hypothetical protein
MTEEREEFSETRQRAVDLRKGGHTYEEIAETLGFLPVKVYAWCHPEKSADQLDAWEEKHHPELAAVRRESYDLMLNTLLPNRSAACARRTRKSRARRRTNDPYGRRSKSALIHQTSLGTRTRICSSSFRRRGSGRTTRTGSRTTFSGDIARAVSRGAQSR